ncbi:hypothetical protein PGT21_028182 [Puccinia graminis f. sp. tritici]|uniref:Uncharacterized protein n=1 Tax=Puccinia graminis f. sp. tritici TaxID=56615 RepID=A0A5B0MQ93_PUCGR|nr:hypothetical protein PGT21_028182 [Puccinia graminis f. sp. tritici]
MSSLVPSELNGQQAVVSKGDRQLNQGTHREPVSLLIRNLNTAGFTSCQDHPESSSRKSRRVVWQGNLRLNKGLQRNRSTY